MLLVNNLRSSCTAWQHYCRPCCHLGTPGTSCADVLTQSLEPRLAIGFYNSATIALFVWYLLAHFHPSSLYYCKQAVPGSKAWPRGLAWQQQVLNLSADNVRKMAVSNSDVVGLHPLLPPCSQSSKPSLLSGRVSCHASLCTNGFVFRCRLGVWGWEFATTSVSLKWRWCMPPEGCS